jgi:hypothetical protein
METDAPYDRRHLRTSTPQASEVDKQPKRATRQISQRPLSSLCCEYAASRLLFAGSYSCSAGQVPEGFGACLTG